MIALSCILAKLEHPCIAPVPHGQMSLRVEDMNTAHIEDISSVTIVEDEDEFPTFSLKVHFFTLHGDGNHSFSPTPSPAFDILVPLKEILSFVGQRKPGLIAGSQRSATVSKHREVFWRAA